MAEHFHGRNDTVDISNSGCESLLCGLIATAERMAPSPALATVLVFLRDRLRCHDGFRAFSLDPPPPELRDADRLQSLAFIVSALAGDLAQGRPNPAMQIQWDRKLEMHWLALMVRLHAVIGEALPPGTETLPPLKLELASQDRAQCEIYQLDSWLARYDRSVQRGERPRDPKVRLALVERILTAAERLEPSESRDQLVLYQSVQRADLLLELGDRAGAAAAYRTAIVLERDSEVRQQLEEIVGQLEGRQSRPEGG